MGVRYNPPPAPDIKPEGDAQTQDVLSGYTFSNAEALGRYGSIPRVTGQTYTPGRKDQVLPKAYYTECKVAGEPNLLPGHIAKGLSLFGVEGVANIGSKCLYVEGVSDMNETTGEATVTQKNLPFQPKALFGFGCSINYFDAFFAVIPDKHGYLNIYYEYEDIHIKDSHYLKGLSVRSLPKENISDNHVSWLALTNVMRWYTLFDVKYKAVIVGV